MERTFVMIKPDGVRRKLVGEILSRFERRGFDIIAPKMLTPSQDLAREHYESHKDKPFFPELVDFVTSGPVVAFVLEGENAIRIVRQMMGTLDPLQAVPGSIRGDFTLQTRENVIHGSDSDESAQREISIWFSDEELN